MDWTRVSGPLVSQQHMWKWKMNTQSPEHLQPIRGGLCCQLTNRLLAMAKL